MTLDKDSGKIKYIVTGGDFFESKSGNSRSFFTAFKALKNKERDAFLEKVISVPELREDLFDVALIEKAKKVKGKTVSAKKYFAKRRKMESAA